MIRCATGISALVLAAGLMAGCAQLPFFGTAGVTERRQQAEELIRQGNLAEALVELRVLETLRPHDPEIIALRRWVEADAKRLAESRFQEAEAAAKKNSREAWRDYVAVLAYDPQHEGALRRLRQIELQRNRGSRPRIGGPEAPTKLADSESAVQMAGPVTTRRPPPEDFPLPLAKPEPPQVQSPAVATGRAAGESRGDTAARQSLDQAVADVKAGTYLDLIAYAESYLAEHPGDDKAVELLALSHEKAGLALYRDGKLRQSLRHLEFAVKYSGNHESPPATALATAKARLASETYEQGVRAFRQDISQAIAYWEETLTYDPEHVKAREYLMKAYRIRETLNEISNP